MVEGEREQPGRVPAQRSHPVGLAATVVHEAPGLAPEAAGVADQREVRRLVAGAGVASGVGEGLDRDHRVSPARLEVTGQAAQHERKHRGGKVRAPVRLEHAEPLVIGEIAQAPVPLGVAPADQRLTRAHAQRGRAEADERAPAAIEQRDVAHRFADETSAEPVLSTEGRIEALALLGMHETNDQRTLPTSRHVRPCSTAGLPGVTLGASAQVRDVPADFAGALSAAATTACHAQQSELVCPTLGLVVNCLESRNLGGVTGRWNHAKARSSR